MMGPVRLELTATPFAEPAVARLLGLQSRLHFNRLLLRSRLGESPLWLVRYRPYVRM